MEARMIWIEKALLVSGDGGMLQGRLEGELMAMVVLGLRSAAGSGLRRRLGLWEAGMALAMGRRQGAGSRTWRKGRGGW
jgi:hypothetical protein